MTGFLGVDDSSAGAKGTAAMKIQKNVSGSSSKASTAEYSKSRERKCVPEVCMCVHVCSLWAQKKLDSFHNSANPLCDTNMATNHILH